MIGNRRKINNPLSRRLSRHMNLAILFRKFEPGSSVFGSISPQKVYPWQGDTPVVKAHLWTSPGIHQIEQEIGQVSGKASILAQPYRSILAKSPATTQPPVTSDISQPVSVPTPPSQSDPIWKRLQTILRKHEQKQVAETKESSQPIQESSEQKSVPDSITPQEDHDVFALNTPEIDSSQPEATAQKIIAHETEPSPAQREISPLPVKSVSLPTSKTTPIQPDLIPTTDVKSEFTQPINPDEKREMEIVPESVSPPRIQEITQPSPPIQASKEIIDSTIPESHIGIESVTPPEKQPHLEIPPKKTPIRSVATTSTPLQSTFLHDESPINDAYAQVSTPVNAIQPSLSPTIESKPSSSSDEAPPPPEHPEEPLSKSGIPHPQPIPLEQAWPVESTISTPAVQTMRANIPMENVGEIPKQVPPAETVQNQQNVINQILEEVSPAQPTDSSIEIIPPRQPRPIPAIQKPIISKKETDNISPDLAGNRPTEIPETNIDQVESGNHIKKTIPTEIGPLPADLWHLIGEKPPLTEINKSQMDSGHLQKPFNISKSQNEIENQPLSENYSPNQPSFPVLPESSRTIPQPTAIATSLMTAPIQRQAETAPATSPSQATGSSAEEGEDEGKKDQELKELARKVYLEVRKRIFLENERSRLH